MKTFKEFINQTEVSETNESMVAGDSGDDPKKIASGEKSGAITNISAGLKKKKEDKDAESK